MPQLMPLADALSKLLNSVKSPNPSQIETLSLYDCQDRICAQNISSPINVPSFDNSAMDGYAVRLIDLDASNTMKVSGKIFAGQPLIDEWPQGTALRIMTGAMVPAEADAVIMQEQVTVNSDASVTFNAKAVKGQNIRRLGEDVKQGDIVLTPGQKLNARSLPLLASLGIVSVDVYKRIKVGILSTGDELVEVGKPLSNGQIYDTNRFMVKLLLNKLNCEILDFGILPDNEELFREKFIDADSQVDVLITSGGVSVGEADFTKVVLESLGQINFWKLAIKPGKPFAFGKLPNAIFCGLPGNPVSAFVTFYQLVQPLIAKLQGQQNYQVEQLQATVVEPLKKSPDRLDFQRGYYSVSENGSLVVKPIGMQGSHIFNALTQSNCFISLEQERGNVSQGETVTIEPFNQILD